MMTTPCSQCGSEMRDREPICKFCAAWKCLLCEQFHQILRFPFLELKDHLATHLSNSLSSSSRNEEEEEVNHMQNDSLYRKRAINMSTELFHPPIPANYPLTVEKSRQNNVFWLKCSKELFGGCDETTISTESNCKQCGKILWFRCRNGVRRHLGEIVYFLRRKTKLIEKGIIVSSYSDDHAILKIRYYDKFYRDPRYDENHLTTEVYSTIEEAEEDFKKTSRRSRSNEVNDENTSVMTIVDEESSLSNSAILDSEDLPSIQTDTSLTKEKLKRSRLTSTSTSTTETVPSMMSTSLRKPKKIRKEEKYRPIEDKIATSALRLDEITSPDDVARRKILLSQRIDEIELEELLRYIVIQSPPTSIPGSKFLCEIDYCIQRGLLFAIYKWARPTMRKVELDSLGNSAKKPPLLLSTLEDLLKYCPTSEKELKRILSCRYLLESYPDSDAMSSTSESATILKSHGEEVIDIIVNYLQRRQRYPKTSSTIPSYFNRNISTKTLNPMVENDRNFSRLTLEQLQGLNLKLPLSYDRFLDVMEIVYQSVGGRDNIENQKGIKGVVMEEGGHPAMYGGARENFVEFQIIQRTSIGKNNRFLDVGSGIGQVCIQIAATVGCRCYGLEIIQERHEAAVCLVEAFDKILAQIGILDRIGPKIVLKKTDFAFENEIIARADVTFFNNFGKWFNCRIPGKTIDYCHEYCQQILLCDEGSQILCLNPLVEASAWLYNTTFQSSDGDFTWTDKPVTVYMYTVSKTKAWICSRCTLMNPMDNEECDVCLTKRRNYRAKVTRNSKSSLNGI